MANGGHGIPDKDVERRYVESLGRLPEVIQLVIRVGLTDLLSLNMEN